ncbi:MAG: hypothetical protein OEN49_09115 [Gammaproteobacteria bacterium]|nr:hypothetical protein [Gammaproteobacteria bacterium]
MKQQRMISRIGDSTEVVVLFDYTPGQPSRMVGDVWDPPAPEEAEISKVMIGDDDISESLSVACMQRLEDECIAYIEDEREAALEMKSDIARGC